ncbi:head morphogenesis protein [Rhizobium phage RHph_I4]|nr:head morphogenesis protein [Rhizobium phage RHph_I4]
MDMITVATDLTVQRVAIDDWLDQLEPQEDEEADPIDPKNDPFLEYELVIASVLAERASDFIPEAEEIIEKAFYIPVTQKAAGDRTREYTARIEEAIAAVEQAQRLWENKGLSISSENAISYALGDALTAGTKSAYDMTGSLMQLSNQARATMIDGMLAASKYYSNAFFNAQVMPALVRAIQLGAGTTGDNLIWSTIKDVLNKRLKTVPYWRVVANAAASRAYHYGILKSGQAAGRRFFQYHAVLDAKTSTVCWSLHGTQWPVADAISLIERIASAQPEEVKTLAPWLKESDIEQLLQSPMGLRALNIVVPPVHGNCRSTIILV